MEGSAVMEGGSTRRNGASNRLGGVNIIGDESVHQRVVVDVSVPTDIGFVGGGDELHATAVHRGGVQWQPDAKTVRDDFRVPVGLVLMPRRFFAVASRFQNHVPAASHVLRFNAKKLGSELVCVSEIGRFPEFGKGRFRTEHLRQHLRSRVCPGTREIEISALILAGALIEELVVNIFQPVYFGIRRDTRNAQEPIFPEERSLVFRNVHMIARVGVTCVIHERL